MMKMDNGQISSIESWNSDMLNLKSLFFGRNKTK